MGSAPVYQPTQQWTRGVQFVMAGGPLGMLAAVNDEVERCHLANISLILLVIFVLHSVTYRSALSGGIIFLQLATATLLSLAFMAVRGVGLNINTLPVQAVGVGIGVDYAIYIVDRIRQELSAGRESGRGDPHGGSDDRNGGHVHRHDRGRRDRLLGVLEPALPGRDGAAPDRADGDQHDCGGHAGAGALLDPASGSAAKRDAIRRRDLESAGQAEEEAA